MVRILRPVRAPSHGPLCETLQPFRNERYEGRLMVGAAARILPRRPDRIRSQRHTSQRQQLSIQQLEYEKPKKAA
jgi:hypothetical protein